MRGLISFLALGIGALAAVCPPALADAYEDQCVISASKDLPRQAELLNADTTNASKDLIRRAQRDEKIRWVDVKLHLTMAGRPMTQEYLCGKAASGRIVVMSVR